MVPLVVHRLEPKVNERTEAASIQSTKAEDERQDADNECDDVLSAVIFGEVDLVLHFEAELREGEEREEGGHHHSDVEMRVVAEMERREIKGKQALDEHPRQIDALDAEEAAGQHDDEEGEEHGGDAPQSFVELLQEQLVGADEDALQGTIDHEVPCRTMP